MRILPRRSGIILKWGSAENTESSDKSLVLFQDLNKIPYG